MKPNEFRAKVFKSGNSVALRLPKALGIAEGTEMVVREEAGRFAFEPAPPIVPRIDLTGVWGSHPGLQPLARAEMPPREMSWVDGPYDE